MNRIHKRKLLHQLTSHLLEQRGHEKPEGYDIEWDPMEPDSQYSMCYEDVEIILNALGDLGYELCTKTNLSAYASQTYYPPKNTTNVTASGNVRIK